MGMHISTKGQYGTRAMLELALHFGRGPLLLREIARRQDIPERYLEHVVAPLRTAGLIQSVRGARGGYTLTRPPSEITLLEILQPLEGGLEPVGCLDNPGACNRTPFCATRDVWQRLQESIHGVLAGMTLEDVVRIHREKARVPAGMYYI